MVIGAANGRAEKAAWIGEQEAGRKNHTTSDRRLWMAFAITMLLGKSLLAAHGARALILPREMAARTLRAV
ncbi:hypothetical protein [Streptosporangium roseum]|uniref:hypothetical protein n=1 Tax=Streptosporangium roseum TaxID=2001 RepID=UPI0004CD9AA0|nr:hypothetical protein [Streptosporangium roseum]